MNNSRNLKLSIVMNPNAGQAPRDAEFVRATRAVTEAFSARFGSRVESLRINPGPFNRPDQPWVGTVDAVTNEPALIWEIHAWLLKDVRPRIPNSSAGILASNDPDSVVHARWVKLESDWYNVEVGPEYTTPPNEYPQLCSSCGWRDLDQVPDPFLVDPCVTKAGSREFFHAGNGVLVLSERVRVLLASLIPGQFVSGAVAVRGKKPPAAPMYWVRPVHRIGAYVKQQRRGEPCPSCARPDAFVTLVNAPHEPGGALVDDFGDHDWNLALVGKYPTHADRARLEKVPAQHDIVIAGGLYAVLYNQKVKGLRWPDAGPYVSRRAHDLTWTG